MTAIKKYKTDFLYSKPSFLTGIGSVFNLAGNYFIYNYADAPQEADSKALESDWNVIGQDMDNAINEIEMLVEKDKKEYSF